MPKKSIKEILQKTQKKLNKKSVKNKKYLQLKLHVVFVNNAQAKKINKQFRNKNYATDILSFQGDATENFLGELVLCPQILKKQAKQHGLSFRRELEYMLIHGVLHLLGYDHEKSRAQAREMFALQDEVFG